MTFRIFEYYKVQDLSLGPRSKTPVLDNILCNKNIMISKQVLGLLESKLSLVPVCGERIDWGASWKQTEIQRYFTDKNLKVCFLDPQNQQLTTTTTPSSTTPPPLQPTTTIATLMGFDTLKTILVFTN